MNTRTVLRRRHAAAPVTVRSAGWLSAGILLATAALGPAAHTVAAASVIPTPVNTGNPRCSDFAPAGETWHQFKLDGDRLKDGIYTDGTITVTITNFADSASGSPGSFDWAADQGVDAVFVKAGSSKHNLYVYSPEATSDEGVGPQAGRGNGIGHVLFCYDGVDVAQPVTSADPTEPPSADPSDDPTVDRSDDPTVEPSDAPSADPSDAPSAEPSDDPTVEPSDAPSADPTVEPSDAP